MRRLLQSPSFPATERVHPDSGDLDLCSTRELVRRLHREDRFAVRAVGRILPAIAQAAQAAALCLKSGGRIIYVGAGSSGRLGVLDAAECPPTFGASRREVTAILAGGARAVAHATEGAEDNAAEGKKAIRHLQVDGRDFVCGISASSSTRFVLAALREARRRKATTALVCCNDSATARKAADLVLLAETGPELIAGSTRLKAGTATKLILNAVSTAAFVSLGRVYRGRMVNVKPSSQKLRTRAQNTIAELANVSPSRARALLRHAGGRVQLAIAMHLTGLPPDAARLALDTHDLRRLEILAARR
ncbi:MAG TPA: N-acetylmuramic acid 6-phosphate etherase [Myxococcaceae bacterium]|nr:N-acetylmuramic acid 6-phosphate etherase [Myxococcaceae bacterium]